MNRRQLLATVTTSTAIFAGCSFSSGEDTRLISTDSEVRRQSSNVYPPVIEFSLTNESDDPFRISANGKKPFVNFPRLTAESSSLVLLPTTDPHLHWDVATTRTNGCWRFVDADGNETHVVYNDIADSVSLEPGQTHRVTHQLYYDGDDSDCFPDGDYTADHTVEFHDAEKTVPFNVQVTVSDTQISTVEVRR